MEVVVHGPLDNTPPWDHTVKEEAHLRARDKRGDVLLRVCLSVLKTSHTVQFLKIPPPPNVSMLGFNF